MNRLVTDAAPPLVTVTMLGDCGDTQGRRKSDKAAKGAPAEEISKVLNSNEENDLTFWGRSKSRYKTFSLHAGGLHCISSDCGPTAMFRRQHILDRHGLKVPTKGEECIEVGEVLDKTDDSLRVPCLPSHGCRHVAFSNMPTESVNEEHAEQGRFVVDRPRTGDGSRHGDRPSADFGLVRVRMASKADESE